MLVSVISIIKDLLHVPAFESMFGSSLAVLKTARCDKNLPKDLPGYTENIKSLVVVFLG